MFLGLTPAGRCQAGRGKDSRYATNALAKDRVSASITTEANHALSSIHHYVPVVLPPDVWPGWLDPSIVRRQRLTAVAGVGSGRDCRPGSGEYPAVLRCRPG
jgi:hypothetical protein